MALDCLDTLVGLTDKDCDCFTTDRPVNYNTSDSGFYLTDPEYGFPTQQAVFENTPCEDGFWDAMTDARTKAIQSFKTDLRSELSRIREKTFPVWEGYIGKIKWNTYNRNALDTAGVQLRPIRRKHGFIQVNKIFVGLDTSQDITLTVKSTDPSFVEQSYTITATADTFVEHEIVGGLRLPMYRKGLDELHYFFEFERDGAQALNNELWCCGGRQWMQYVKAGGYQFNQSDISRFDRYGLYNNQYANGLALDVQFECDDLDWLCDLTSVNGYDLRDVTARCIQFKAAINLIAYVLDSGKVNRYSVLESDRLTAKAGHLNEMYQDNIYWLVQNLPASITGCWGCKKHEPKVNSIMT